MHYAPVFWDFDGTLAEDLPGVLRIFNDLTLQFGLTPVAVRNNCSIGWSYDAHNDGLASKKLCPLFLAAGLKRVRMGSRELAENDGPGDFSAERRDV